MINFYFYSSEQLDKIYSCVEEAVATRKPIKFWEIERFLLPGDFYWIGNASANGYVFEFNGLRWIEDGEIYSCRIQPQILPNSIIPEWVPIISRNERTGSSSGVLSMIKKENRYDKTIRYAGNGLRNN